MTAAGDRPAERQALPQARQAAGSPSRDPLSVCGRRRRVCRSAPRQGNAGCLPSRPSVRILKDRSHIYRISAWRARAHYDAGRGKGETNVMPGQRLKVGIVGLQPGRSWAARAHVPALRALPETFEIVGVANTTLASAEKAAAETGLPRAFADVAALITAPEVDIVAVTVKVPPHFEIVKAAIAAGKHVYCEWPLGNGLAEAEEMAALAQAEGVQGVVGTQARVAPEIEYLRRLIADGFVGDVLSTTLVARGGALQGGGSIPDKKTWAYLLDRSNGATLLTIPVGHTLAALRDVFGEV